LIENVVEIRTNYYYRSSLLLKLITAAAVDDDDDEERINFSVALSPKTTRTRNNKLKQ